MSVRLSVNYKTIFIKVMVDDGATVNAGDPLVVMIAMKMEYVIKVTLTFSCWVQYPILLLYKVVSFLSVTKDLANC